MTAATLFGVSAAGAHTRSQSHSVWEIKGADVDLVMTIPAAEAGRLSTGGGAPSDERMKAYLGDGNNCRRRRMMMGDGGRYLGGAR